VVGVAIVAISHDTSLVLDQQASETHFSNLKISLPLHLLLPAFNNLSVIVVVETHFSSRR
jgi:hypothetical protein